MRCKFYYRKTPSKSDNAIKRFNDIWKMKMSQERFNIEINSEADKINTKIEDETNEDNFFCWNSNFFKRKILELFKNLNWFKLKKYIFFKFLVKSLCIVIFFVIRLRTSFSSNCTLIISTFFLIQRSIIPSRTVTT